MCHGEEFVPCVMEAQTQEGNLKYVMAGKFHKERHETSRVKRMVSGICAGEKVNRLSMEKKPLGEAFRGHISRVLGPLLRD